MNDTYCKLLPLNLMNHKNKLFMVVNHRFINSTGHHFDKSLLPDSIFDFTEMDLALLKTSWETTYFVSLMNCIKLDIFPYIIEKFLQDPDSIFFQKYSNEIIEYLYGKKPILRHGGSRFNAGRKALPKSEKKETTSIRIKPELKKRIKQAATEKQMTFNFYIETTLENSLC